MYERKVENKNQLQRVSDYIRRYVCHNTQTCVYNFRTFFRPRCKTVFISLDFIQNIPTSPNFYLLKNIETCPDVKMTEEQQEDFIKIFTLIEKYDNKSILNKQIQDALTLSLILIATSLFDNIQMNKKVPYSRQEDLTRCFLKYC